MDNGNSERKEKLKRVVKLGIKCAWVVVDWLV